MIEPIAEVALEGASVSFDKRYSYLLDKEGKCAVGCRVIVPFGKADLKRQGIVLSIRSQEDGEKKRILSVIDEAPVLSAELLGLCEIMKERTFCTYYDAVKAMLPAGISYKMTDSYTANPEFASLSLLNETQREIVQFIARDGEVGAAKLKARFADFETQAAELVEKEALLKNCGFVRNMNDATQKWLRLTAEAGQFEGRLTPRQREVVGVLSDVGSVSAKELKYFTGVTDSVINTLIRKGLLLAYEKEVFRTPYRSLRAKNRSEIRLTAEQQTAYTGMKESLQSGEFHVALLHGVTGSGKTQVFLKLIDDVSDQGLGVILMVPEISLTPQMIRILGERYGSKIAVFHSAMSNGQRMDEWKRIRNGSACIAVGTRSAVFAPFEKLGLIIIDEEQEHTYKSEKTPKYHARELAMYRASAHHALVCLASATPSMESFSAARSGKYSLYTLKNRYGNACLPEVSVVDMKKEILTGNSSCISGELYRAAAQVLDREEQAIVLLNRRGHHTYISCPSCGYVATCPNCSISLTYHSVNGRLMCHYCGYSKKAEKSCPECGAENMRYMGLGTQKVVEELQTLFPAARILRLDADSTTSRDSFPTLLREFSEGKYDIMVGTQMVAKGLDFPRVTLVGVLGADTAAYREDFRSFERTFSLLTQVVGRAGRGDVAGRAVVQTTDPDGRIIELAAKQDYISFYEEEIRTRKLMIYPPFCDICTVAVSSANRELAEASIREIFARVKEQIEQNYPDVRLIILGPSPAAIPKMNHRYRFRMMIKCRNSKRFRDLLREAIHIKLSKDLRISVDMNPETVI